MRTHRIAVLSAAAAMTAVLGSAGAASATTQPSPSRITTHQQLAAELVKAITVEQLSGSDPGGGLCGYIQCPDGGTAP